MALDRSSMKYFSLPPGDTVALALAVLMRSGPFFLLGEGCNASAFALLFTFGFAPVSYTHLRAHETSAHL
eukprot:9769912-Alexandrium_andersonii.AAC.1